MSEQVQQSEMKPAPYEGASSSSLGKIIVVDDEPQLKKILVEALTVRGFEVIGCSSGQLALEELRKKEFDLLLTDLMMPEMNGIALLEAALKIDPHVIGIIMTGQGTIQTAIDAMKVGAFDYVLKPFRLQTVMPVLTRAINTRRLRMENLQLRETVAIYSLCQTIAFTLDQQTLLSRLADAALEQSDADEVSILLPTSDGTELYVAAVRGETREQLLGERVPLQDSISSWVARQRTPLILNGQVSDERFVALWPRPEIRSAVAVPMQAANKLVGIINLNLTSHLRPFTLGQMKALTILASTAAAALGSASLYAQVRATEEKYRSIFENATEGLFQSTIEGRLLTVNPAFARIMGYDSPEETIATLIDITHQLYVNPEDRAQAGRLQEQGTLQGFEFEAYRKDGEKIWLTVNRRCVRNPNGEVLYFEGSIEDVTTRRHIEEENRKTRQQYESLVQSIDGVVWEFDVRSSNFSFVSNQCERLLGYTSEQWLSDPDFWKDHLHPDDCAWVLEFCRDAMARRADHEFDYRMIAADGRVVWFRDIVTMDYTNPDVPHLRGVMVDITDRKLSEDELKKSEERYRELVENAHDLIYEHDLNGNYTSANKAGERLTGYTLEEALKLNLAQTVAPEYLEKAKDMLRRKLAGETVTAYELVVIAKDGRRIPVEVNTRLVLKNGVPVGVQGIARDITERKRVEEIQARRAAHTSFRADISAALALSTAPLRTTLASCVTAMVEHLGAAFARIWTLNRDGETLELQASVGMYTDLDGPYSRIPIGSFKTGKIAQERAPHITNQVQNDPEVSEEWARQQGLVAFAGYPLLLDSRLLGVMVMFSREELPEDTLDALASVADLISQGIERKRAEEGLRESEERYRLLFESNPQAMWVYDLETLRFLAVNEAAVQHYGYSREDFLSMTVKDILPAEDIPALYESFSSSCEHVDAAGTWRHLKKDGSLIEVEITSHLLRFDERQAELILAHDITERRQAEASRMHLLQRLVTAQEEEQRRLSRELHDQTGQSLAALMLGLKSIEDSGQLREAARNRLSQLQELTNQLARDVHQLASNLRPSALDDLGLHTALSNYVEEWSDRTKIRADFHSNGLLKRRLPRQIETAVYRVVQEALTNVFKHANAKNVSVILKYRGNRMQAIVEDDGRGFDSELLASAVNGDRRLGLLGMQERVALVQGHLNIESRAGAGTTVIVHIPVSTEQAEAQTE